MMVEQHYSIISLVVENEPGVLARISTLFSRKGYNLETVNVGKIPGQNLSSMIFTIYADSKTLEQIIKQTDKLIHTLSITIHSDEQSIVREHCLVRLETKPRELAALESVAKKNSANTIYKDKGHIVFELVGSPEKVSEFIEAVKGFDIKEVRRTGINAVTKNGY